MKLPFLFAFALVAVGCSTAAADVGSTDDAISATNDDPVCFAVQNHPFNGNGEVWKVDGTSLIHTQTFYWHGEAMRDFLGEMTTAPESFPLIESSDTKVTAGTEKDPITIDIDTHGLIETAVMHRAGHDDIVLPWVARCI